MGGAPGGGFVWRDAGRTVVLRRGALAAAPRLLAAHGVGPYRLVTTARALAAAEAAGADALAAGALSVHTVAPGQVPPLAAALLDELPAEERPEAPPALVALGGGRVIDVAKAAAAVTGAAVAALPTTLSGAEMTAIHRLPAGHERRVRAMRRPALVLADPEAMAGRPGPGLRASAMNALAHGADSLYTSLANPLAELAALRGAAELAAALDGEPAGRDAPRLALGSLLCGYAIDSAGFGLHHVVCQSLVRACGTPHAETNAAFLPVAVRFLRPQAPRPFDRLAEALGTRPERLAERVRELGGDPPGLGELGADRAGLDAALEAMLARPELAEVPEPPTSEQLRRLVEAAW